MLLDTIRVLLLSLGVLAGASSQRVTGLGFALVSSPLLVLVVGPYDGVLLANLLSLVVSLAVLSTTWRHVDPTLALPLAVPAVLVVPAGAYAASHLPEPVLMTLIGAMTVSALAVVILGGRIRFPAGRAGAATAGACSGLLNSSAGVGGPPLVVYAASTGWPHAQFVATTQLCFALTNAASVLAKGLPQLPPVELGAALVSLAVGVVVGQLIASRIDSALARRVVVWLAFAGASATLVKGVQLW